MTYIPELLHPVNQPFRVSQEFGENPQIYKQFGMLAHNARDYAVVTNTPVYASLSGPINEIANHPKGYGLHIKIKHEMGDETVYAHLSKVSVKEGDFVYTGQLIGYSGNTGFSTAPHLHFGYRPPQYNQNNGYAGYIDPKPFLKLTPNEYQNMLEELKKEVDELKRNVIRKDTILFDTKDGSFWKLIRHTADPKETRHSIDTKGNRGAEAFGMEVAKPVTHEYILSLKEGKPFPSRDV